MLVRGFWIALLLPACHVLAAPLDELPVVRDLTSHRASSYDVTGGNSDSLLSLAPKSTHVLLDTDGPGCIRHMWMTLAVFPNNTTFLRDLVVRIYWEKSRVRSVEAPLGDFFALGHCRRYPIESVPILVGQNPAAFNCYWPMPFYHHARIELYNSGVRSIRRFYFHIDYELGEIAPRQAYFHAAFRRDRALRGQEEKTNPTGRTNYVVLDAKGEGQYVGCVLFVDGEQAERWYEGDDMIFIDGDETPTLHGTGTEDYFGNAWGYEGPFCYPYYGAPLLERRSDGGIYATLYRWHIADPIHFKKSIRVTFEHLFQKGLVNDYSSVAYWYQRELIQQREPLPENNYPIVRRAALGPSLDLNATELEPTLSAAGIPARALTAELNEGYMRGGYLQIQTRGHPVHIQLQVPDEGRYRVEVKPVLHLIEGQIQMGVEGSPLKMIPDQPRDPEKRVAEGKTPFFNVGSAQSADKKVTLVVAGNDVIGLDHIRLYRCDPTASEPRE